MAKRRKPISVRAAAILRKGIEDGRSDAERWGYSAPGGEDSPRWRASFYWRGIGGEPQWIQDLYEKSYSKARGQKLRELWAQRSSAELREARVTAARNRGLRWETGEDRERRLLREKVAGLQQELNAAAASVDLNAHRQPEAVI